MFKNSNRLFCFSPAAMMLTFVIEIILAIYTLARYKMTPLIRVTASMLALLALFQLAEYNVCGSSSARAFAWSRVGYVAITLLPPLGLHLIHIVTGRKSRILMPLAYITGIMFAITFGLSSSSFIGHACTGNYAIFQLTRPLGGLYFVYYYSLLFIGVGLSLYYSLNAKQKVREALIMQVFGYLSFLLPTGVVNAMNPETISGIPSIMCGFAVIYAIILTVGIVPTLQKTKQLR